MKEIILSLVLFCTLVGPAAVAADDDDDEGTIVETAGKKSPYGEAVGNAALTSDFIFRGVSQTDHAPAVQAGMDWEHPTGIYLGVWGTNVHFPDSPASLELDGSGGYTYNFTPSLSASLGVMYYSFHHGSSLNSWEFPLKLTWKTLSATANYDPPTGASSTAAWYFSLGWSDQYFWKLTLGAAAGYSIPDEALELQNYADFHFNVSREVLGVVADISYYFVNHPQQGGLDDPRLVFTVSKTF